MKREKGITLIALIITVIILLILAGVAIASLGNSGLFNKTQGAVGEYKNAENKEQETLNEIEGALNDLSNTPEAAPDTYVVKFPDEVLKQLIKNKLGVANDEELTYGKLKTITNLTNMTASRNLVVNKIKDLKGLEYLINLRQLYITGQSIVDLKPLANLKYLETIELNGNLISDVKPISNLPKLASLNLSHNNISDISSFTKLKTFDLYLNFNQIVDFTPVLHLKDREGEKIYVNISNNPGTWPGSAT